MERRSFGATLAALTVVGVMVPSLAAAQDLPKKPIALVVGFAAGGAADAAARVVARKLQEELGQSVVVENRAGAGGNVAHQYVTYFAPADGSVILLGSVGPLTIAPHLMKVGYDPLKDLVPLTMAVSFPNVLVVNADTRIRSLADYIARARARPGFSANSWYAFVASARMPAALAERWSRELVRALTAPEVKAE